MPRKSKGYAKPDLVFKSLTKCLFKVYQLRHHSVKWNKCPLAFENRIKNIVSKNQMPKLPAIFRVSYQSIVDAKTESFLKEFATSTKDFLIEAIN